MARITTHHYFHITTLDLERILDCFHIGQKFQNVLNALGESFEESLDSVKWSVWHGEAQAALTKLKLLQDNITDDAKQSKIQELLGYLKNNLNYLINYEQRKKLRKSLYQPNCRIAY